MNREIRDTSEPAAAASASSGASAASIAVTPAPLAKSAPEAFAWMAASATLFALMNFFARIAGEHLSWTVVTCVRALIGAAVALLVARMRGANIRVRNQRGMWWRAAWGTGAMLCTFYSVSSPALPLGDSVTLLNLTPVFLAVLAPLLIGERAGRRVGIALPLSLAGTVLVMHPAFLFGGAALSRASLVVAFVCIGGALCTCFAMMMLRTLGKSESPEAIALQFSLVAAAVAGVLAVPHLAIPSARDALWILATGICAGLGQLCMTRAYALERAARVSGVSYLSIVVSASLGAIALHEWPGGLAIAGMLLVITGGLVVTVAGLRDRTN